MPKSPLNPDHMHPALDIAEIRGLIAAAANKSDNVALAQVSKGFLPFALDEIWRTLDTIDPILDLVPVAPTPTSETSWERFMVYADRVRKLDLLHSPKSPASTVAALCRRASDIAVPLFPRLNTISAPTIISASQIHLLELMVSSELVSFTILESSNDMEQGPEEFAAWTSLLKTLRLKAPRLKTLELDIPGSITLDDSLQQLIKSSSALTLVTLGPVCQSGGMIHALGHLPRLKTLLLVGEPTEPLANWASSNGKETEGSFRALQQLGAPHRTLPGIIGHISSPEFHTILTTHNDPTEAFNFIHGLPPPPTKRPSLPRLIPSIANSLKSIYLDVRQPALDGVASIEPLLSCSKLESIVIEGWATLGNEQVHPGWGRHWPVLEVLSCTPAGSGQAYSHLFGREYLPTLASVGILSRHCQALRMLDIPVDASDFSFKSEDFVPLKAIEKLSVKNWWVCKDGEIAGVKQVLEALAAPDTPWSDWLES